MPIATGRVHVKQTAVHGGASWRANCARGVIVGDPPTTGTGPVTVSSRIVPPRIPVIGSGWCDLSGPVAVARDQLPALARVTIDNIGHGIVGKALVVTGLIPAGVGMISADIDIHSP